MIVRMGEGEVIGYFSVSGDGWRIFKLLLT